MAAEDFSEGKVAIIQTMVSRIKELEDEGLQTVDLFNCWLGRRLVPLQRRTHPMYMYTESTDPTRVLSTDWEERDYAAALKCITDAEFTGWKPSVTPYEPKKKPAPTVSTLSCRQSELIPVGFLLLCQSEHFQSAFLSAIRLFPLGLLFSFLFPTSMWC